MRGSIEQEIGALKADNVRNKNQLAELFRQSKEHSDQRAALNTDFAVLSEQLDEAVVSMNGLGGTLEGLKRDQDQLARTVAAMKETLEHIDAKQTPLSFKLPDLRTSATLLGGLFFVAVIAVAIRAPDLLPVFFKAAVKVP